MEEEQRLVARPIIDYVKMHRVDAALQFIVKERGGDPKGVSVMNFDSYKPSDLDQALTMLDGLL
jgi:hypothetical protein